MNQQDWANQPSPFKGQYLPTYSPIARWVMPIDSKGLQDTYYYNLEGQLVKEVFNQSGKRVDLKILKTNLFTLY
ncbi:hypothetical protein CLI64_13655 [Nostoc sp. CENA543]|uniref:hypothetical protein n=1 Tax=Nostoc sp. CENA543 TaxID=1869241 RepID=UPI000CA2336E|nr:hypothetical protein [Nostoc sp. CENA543]AUT01362.1 hypothetical protein CLI64_13655 [Nostoc sp. CENA543]